MKKPLAIIAALVLCFTIACTMPMLYPKQEKCACPAEDIIITIQSPVGDLLVPIPKGSLDDPTHYMTPEQYQRLIEEGKARPVLPNQKTI